ncbi:hypothetical protein N7462_009257 [Penicillium macrosclerotiorum]|uniref:uncharacterized protein n=1 Tax=Penicillium macrosclerotiorum TaxID=303699 RepID=UPI002547848D|nr:uncharacterized protein N7462_009257 [Penicillium macrosclerotiorum]KAJ5673818.1 hypothetical protein N7462_009257 [Penicillium macrosclerotiorum]
MTTQGPSALPPTTVHSTKTISQSAAHEFLASYLERANTDPSLQPNSSIGENGPVSRTTAAAPNLILHNLKRVQAGLAGEILGQDLTVAKQNPNEEYLDIAAGSASKTNQNEEGDEQEQADLEMKDAEMEAEAFSEQEKDQTTIDKEERKRKKKERRQAEKKAKAKKDVGSD